MRIVAKVLLFLTTLQTYSFAQVGYVPIHDEIYKFLDRVNSQGMLENYDPFELPKTRREIRNHLRVIHSNFDFLDEIDKNKLSDFLIEFEFDLVSTQNLSNSLFPKFKFNYLLVEKEKYLYKYFDDVGNSFFINFIGQLDYLSKSDLISNNKNNSLLYRFGGEIRGTFFNDLGFSLRSTNGSFTGNKGIAQNFSSLRYNYKFHRENEDNTGDNYFDETAAFLAYENNYAKIKIGNDRKTIGHGLNKIVLGEIAPRMDYLSLDLNYKFLDFSFFHGKLLGSQTVMTDTVQGTINNVADKYISYHRFGFNFSKHLKFGIGEIIIYSNRNIDISYLNPFNFFKSAEHANQDRDNSFLIFDIQNNSIRGLKLYSTILIDDIDFGKLGNGWYGNQSIISVGMYSSLLYNIVPLDFELQYIKIDPYVYTHRIQDNNYTNSGYSLGSDLQPNSSSSLISFYYRPHYRINISFGFRYTLHGANIYDEDGNLLENFGGNIENGHRPDDPEEIYFLSGSNEISRDFSFKTTYEPIKDLHFSINFDYKNNNLTRSQNLEELFTTFSLYTKF